MTGDVSSTESVASDQPGRTRDTPSVADLAAMAHLFESRLQHLFREQMGMPIIRYALWERMMAAAELLADGQTATYAAHQAGFADSAHLAREFRRFNGQSPTSLGPPTEAITVCDTRS